MDYFFYNFKGKSTSNSTPLKISNKEKINAPYFLHALYFSTSYNVATGEKFNASIISIGSNHGKIIFLRNHTKRRKTKQFPGDALKENLNPGSQLRHVVPCLLVLALQLRFELEHNLTVHLPGEDPSEDV